MWDHLEGILKVLLEKAASGSQVSRKNPQKEFFGSANGDLPGLTIADCSETDK